MLISVIVNDAIELKSSQGHDRYVQGVLSILLYADDTLLVGASETGAQEVLDAIAGVAFRYGMELHWHKFQLLQVNGKCKLLTPTGEDAAALGG